MELCINTLLDHIDATAERRIDRVLRISSDATQVALIQVHGEALPRIRIRAELDEQIACGELRPIDSDPFADLSCADETIPKTHRQRRDKNYALIAPIIQLPGMDEFIARKRGPIIEEVHRKSGVSKWVIYMYLRRWWQGGLRKNALLPKFMHCGGPGKERGCAESKRGRPRKLIYLHEACPGVNVTKEARRLFRLGRRAFYENEKDPAKRTLREAYHRTVERFFSDGFEVVNGVIKPTTPLASEVPTLEQFRYWYRKDGDSDRSLQIREGKRRYNLRHRGLGGDASEVAFGPGSVFQIDSTSADVYLVSSLDRKRIVGRPILYLIIDVFTRMIAGFCAVLESASYSSAVMALENATREKVEYCGAYGIQISEEEWPSAHLPEMLVADRAELLGKKSNPLVDAFGIRISNTAPHRADLKAFIERLFLTINQKLIHSLPGAVTKPHERGDRDYRLDAALTLNEFRKAVIYFILQHNRSRVEHYRPRDFMVTDAVEPRPIDLWRWGIKNRSGHLLKHDPEFVKLNLLPGEEATVTERGIRFRKLYYSCDRALDEHWFATARQKGSWRIDIAYDPRVTSTIYVRLPELRTPERCQLMKVSSQFAECSWEEVSDFFDSLDQMKEESRSQDLQNGALYHAQLDHLIANSKTQTESARDGQSKASRIRDIRPNRRAERELERRAGLGDVVPDGEQTSANVIPNKTSPESGCAPDNYVGLPIDIETLEQQRQELCKNP